MINEDDEEEKGSFGQSKYPCMPSLVALQQMRNRLHLAYLGKKLMKWTAMATGRELRRISVEMHGVYREFKDDTITGYMLLARSRYFYPNVNLMVAENIPLETNTNPYPHLGIDKGGQTIRQAKELWLDILKRMINILQLRNSFSLVEAANKSATKRRNVLAKVITPRLHSTLRYIALELEEMAREELYRIKKIVIKKKQKAENKARKGKTDLIIKDICTPDFLQLEIPPPKEDISVKSEEPLLPVQVKEPEPVIKAIEAPPVKGQPIETSRIVPQAMAPFVKITEPPTEKVPVITRESCAGCSDNLPCLRAPCQTDAPETTKTCQSESTKSISKIFATTSAVNDTLNVLKTKIFNAVLAGKNFLEKRVNQVDMTEFVTSCEEAKTRMEEFLKQYVTWPGKVDEYINTRLLELKNQIEEVEQFAEEAEEKGLAAPGVNEFLQSCKRMKLKILLDTSSYSPEQDNRENQKLTLLKKQVSDIEQLTSDIGRNMDSSSIDQFVEACRDFRCKLEQYNCKAKKPTPEAIERLVAQLDEAITLSREAKERGLISESVDDFIKSCEDVKTQLLNEGQSKVEPSSTVLQDLRTNVDDVMQLIGTLKNEDLISASVAEFLKSCEMTKVSIDFAEKYPYDEHEGQVIYPTSSSACRKQNMIPNDIPNDMTEVVCGKYLKIMEEDSASVKIPLPDPICDSCKGIVKEELKKPCAVCPLEEDEEIDTDTEQINEDLTVYVSPELSNEDICDKCQQPIAPITCSRHSGHATDPSQTVKKATSSQPFDSEVGYFENTVRKIVRVTRSLNKDGTIREERETITIKSKKHNPNETSMTDDYDGDGSYESLLDDGNSSNEISTKRVGYVIASNQNQRGFLSFAKARSEILLRNNPAISSCVAQSSSLSRYFLLKTSRSSGLV